MQISRFGPLACACVALAAGWPAGVLATELRAYPSTTKVLDRGGLPAGAAALTVEAARDEYEGFQVAILTSEPLAQVDMKLDDFAGPAGAKIPSTSADFYLERYVHIDKASICDFPLSDKCSEHPEYDRIAGDYPEQLVPFADPYSAAHAPVAAPFSIAAGKFAVVWVDLHVPKDAIAGDYHANLTVSAAGKALGTVPVTLHVWDFAIPAKRSIATAFGFYSHALDKYHGGAKGPDAAAYATFLRNYEWEVHRHRLDFTDYNPGLSFKFDKEGPLQPVDYAAYDAYLAPRIDGSYYPDGAGINRFNVGMFEPGHGNMGLTDEQFSIASAELAKHLKEKGWLEHAYLYSADEPWMPSHAGSAEAIKQSVKLLNKNTNLWNGHVLVTGPWNPLIDGDVDIWCPVTSMYGDGIWPDGAWLGHEKYVEEFKKGHELWFYVCNADFPAEMGYDSDSPLGFEPRLLKWGAWSEGATGFLYWAMTYWQDPNSWDVLRNVDEFGEVFARHGDGILMYPGNHDGKGGGIGSPKDVAIDGPVVSIRMKQVRDGLEDWEMLRLVQAQGGEAYARKQVGRAFARFGARIDDTFDASQRPWTIDDAVLLDARRQIAHKLEYLLQPTAHADPEAKPQPVVDAGATDAAQGLGVQDVAPVDASAAKPHAKASGCAAGAAAGGAAAWTGPLLLGVLGMVRRRRANG